MAKAEWSDAEMLGRVSQHVVPKMDFSTGGFWIIDDTGFPPAFLAKTGASLTLG